MLIRELIKRLEAIEKENYLDEDIDVRVQSIGAVTRSIIEVEYIDIGKDSDVVLYYDIGA